MSVPPTDDLAARLLHVRTIGGLTQARAADAAGVSQQFISLIETRWRGKRPSFAHLSKLAAVFGVSASWLLSGEGPRPSDRRIRTAVERAVAAKASARSEAAQ